MATLFILYPNLRLPLQKRGGDVVSPGTFLRLHHSDTAHTTCTFGQAGYQEKLSAKHFPPSLTERWMTSTFVRSERPVLSLFLWPVVSRTSALQTALDE